MIGLDRPQISKRFRRGIQIDRGNENATSTSMKASIGTAPGNPKRKNAPRISMNLGPQMVTLWTHKGDMPICSGTALVGDKSILIGNPMAAVDPIQNSRAC